MFSALQHWFQMFNGDKYVLCLHPQFPSSPDSAVPASPILCKYNKENYDNESF